MVNANHKSLVIEPFNGMDDGHDQGQKVGFSSVGDTGRDITPLRIGRICDRLIGFFKHFGDNTSLGFPLIMAYYYQNNRRRFYYLQPH
jgi:hypothetical protein